MALLSDTFGFLGTHDTSQGDTSFGGFTMNLSKDAVFQLWAYDNFFPLILVLKGN